jgi:hypothetical protein
MLEINAYLIVIYLLFDMQSKNLVILIACQSRLLVGQQVHDSVKFGDYDHGYYEFRAIADQICRFFPKCIVYNTQIHVYNDATAITKKYWCCRRDR